MIRPRRRKSTSLSASAVLCAAGLLVGLASTPAAPSVPLEVKAFSGMPAPGAAPGLILYGFANAVINEAGEVAFLGFVWDPELELSGDGIFAPDAAGDLTPVSFEFEAVPDLPPGTEFRFGSTYYPRLNDAGQVAFHAGLAAPGGPGEGVWRWSAESGLERLVVTGDPVPEAGPDISVDSVGGDLVLPAIAANGDVAFSSALVDAGYTVSDRALFSVDADGASTLVVREGMGVPEIPGAVFTWLFPGFLNEQGVLSFSAVFEGPGVIAEEDDYGAFTWDAVNGLVLRARAGDPAPEMPPGVTFFGSLGIYPNSAGAFALWTGLAGPGVTEDNDFALYGPGTSGDLVLAARDGSQAPGTEMDSVFQGLLGFSSAVVINADGKVAFAAGLAGPSVTEANEYGIWLFDPDTESTQLCVRMGDPAPDLLGLTLAGVSRPILNDAGVLVFRASLEGPGVTPETDRAIFALWCGGPAELVAREGDLAEFAPGDLRPLLGFSMLSGTESDAAGVGQLNASGQLVFYAHTAEGTSAIVVATLPEPHTASALAAGIALLEFMRSAKRRSRRAGRCEARSQAA